MTACNSAHHIFRYVIAVTGDSMSTVVFGLFVMLRSYQVWICDLDDCGPCFFIPVCYDSGCN